MTEHILHAVFGSGQPGFPGYIELIVNADTAQEAECKARRHLFTAINNRYCSMERRQSDIHVLDRIYRYTIKID